MTPAGRCTQRCQMATSDARRCRCACGGAQHGSSAPNEFGLWAGDAPGAPRESGHLSGLAAGLAGDVPDTAALAATIRGAPS